MLIPYYFFRKLWWLFLLTQLVSCATYYQMNSDFQTEFQRGNIEQALKVLDNKKKAEKGKNRFLFFADKAIVCNMLGKYELSNEYFTQADLYIEDFNKNYGYEILAIFTNPMVKPYQAENYENVMIQYYKAKNYMALGNYDAALVEAKRLNEKLLKISDIQKKNTTYKRDAFGHLLMGLIYDANKDDNNAFIAYRNAYNIYVEDYAKDYKVNAPEQLKKDLLRTAATTGLWDEVNYYEKQWNTKYIPAEKTNNDAVIFWHNGLIPVKAEWSINFTVMPGNNGNITFVNQEFGFSFPFYVNTPDERQRLTDLKIIRVAVPKFNERTPLFNKAQITSGSFTQSLEIAQNLNNIAFQNLRDRTLRDLGVSLLRMALKQAAEAAARKNEKQGIGFAIGLLNAITEKAETRNWQTLPHDIYYTRLPINNNEFNFNANGNRGNTNKRFKISAPIKGNTYFYTTYTLESLN